MHICFLNAPIEYYSPVSGGAVATIIMQSAQALQCRGHEVTVLTITNEDEIYSVGKVIPIDARRREQIHPLTRKFVALADLVQKWDWPYYLYYLRSFTRALRGLNPQPDVVIVFNDLISPQYIKRAVPNTKVFVWLQNQQGTRQKNLSKTLAATTGFLTCSAYIREWTAQKYGIPLDKFSVVHSGVDLGAFYPRPGYTAPSETLRTLFIGRIDPNKGPDIAADAVGVLQREGLSITLTVAGGLWFYGNENQMADPFFRALTGKMEAVSAVYAGHVTRHDVPALLREHDVAFVLSRANEPFGLVALENMASGCAVISSDRGGLPEACGGAAMLADPDDFEAVVGILRRLATQPELLRSQKRRAVERASFASWDSVSEKLIGALDPK